MDNLKDQTVFAYRCPSCGYIVKSVNGIFSLSGSFFRLKCSCGESVASIEKPEGQNITVTVPCMICSYSHVYTMTRDAFFNNNVFVASCPLSGVELCFIGDEKQVDEAIEASNEELASMLDGRDLSSLKADEGSNTALSDPMIFDMVRFVIDDLNAEGKIHCDCEHEGEYSCDVFDEYILVKCNKCLKQKKINIVGTSQALDFLETDELILK